jgi:hypothetical protein
MPRERLEIFRESNTKPKEKIFVLAYEGNNTEAIYFEALKADLRFNDDLIFLVSLRRPKTDTNSAPKHVFRKLKREAKDIYNFDKNDELWMVIDRDKWRNIPQISSMCIREGNFFLALSNPCFEFWLLLHIKDLNDFNPQELKDIYLNKRIKGKRTYLKLLLNSLLEEGYNESDPQPKRFLVHLEDAITRAKSIDNPQVEFPKKLGSHVYKLVEKIIR